MIKKITSLLLVAVCAVVFTGCGTLFRKDRIGKTSSNKIDETILILDVCGLVFGVIPGVVALILDFGNKTIYYSAGEAGSAAMPVSTENMHAVRLENMSEQEIANALSRELGREISYSQIQFAAK